MSGKLEFRYLRLIFKPVTSLKNWLAYYADFFDLIKKKELVLKTRDGLKFTLRPGTTDRGILTTVVLEDEYRINSIKDDIDTMIDLGGNIGCTTVFASKYAKKIFTFEPVPANYGLLLKNIKINNLKNKIKSFNLAVTSNRKPLKMYISPDNTGSHSSFFYASLAKRTDYVMVQTITLDDVFRKEHIKQCDLLKMDIEGGEYDILYNLPDKYYSRIRRIHMEYHDIDNKKQNHKKLMQFLQQKGFTIEKKDYLLFCHKD